MSSLPEDIIMNILSRLEVKSILRSRCVCKPWDKLVRTPQFVKMHLSHAIENEDVSFIIRSDATHMYSMDYGKESSFTFSDDDDVVEIDFPFKSQDFRYAVVEACCDGLLFLEICTADSLFNGLWNPSTREYKKLPMETVEYSCSSSSEIPIVHSIAYGFVYDCNIEDYKVVKVMDLGPHGCEISVYTLRSNSWRWVQHMPYGFFIGRRPGVFVNGVLHWIATHLYGIPGSESIFSFNIRNEGVQEVLTPQNLGVSDVTLGLLGESLCLVSQHLRDRTDVWVLKEYGVTDSWTKLFSISQQTATGDCSILNLIFSFKSGEILFENMNDFSLCVYDPEHGSFIIPKVRGAPMCSYYTSINVRSIVSLDSGTFVGQEEPEETTNFRWSRLRL